MKDKIQQINNLGTVIQANLTYLQAKVLWNLIDARIASLKSSSNSSLNKATVRHLYRLQRQLGHAMDSAVHRTKY